MQYFQFSTKEKAEMFDEIAARYYNRNFGQMSKTDMDLLMFHFYIEKISSVSTRGDVTLDYLQCSDYKMIWSPKVLVMTPITSNY